MKLFYKYILHYYIDDDNIHDESSPLIDCWQFILLVDDFT